MRPKLPSNMSIVPPAKFAAYSRSPKALPMARPVYTVPGGLRTSVTAVVPCALFQPEIVPESDANRKVALLLGVTPRRKDDVELNTVPVGPAGVVTTSACGTPAPL